ncbi:MAG: Gldg family protein [Nannocystaceae bacterium]
MALLPRHHGFLRLLFAGITVASLTYAGQRLNIRSDVTSEGLSRITQGTRDLIRGVSVDRPVVVTAYVSKDVPQQYVSLRSRLLNVLHEMEAEGGAGLTVQIYEPEPHSEEAQEAVEKYGIAPRPVFNNEGGRMQRVPVFLGLAFASGPRDEVLPFLDRGLSVEYEIARALRVVTQEKKRVLGILRTDAKIMGNFDFQSRRQQPAWRIVDELKKQYEVRSLNPGTEVPKDVDVLIVPQVSSMTQEQLDHLKTYVVDEGRAALIIADPMPVFDVRLSPSEPMLPPPGQGGGGMMGMMGGGGGQAPPKGDFDAFLRSIGVEWKANRIVFDTYNPNPRLKGAPPHVVFFGKRPGQASPFEDADIVVDGLAQIVSLFAGDLRDVTRADVKFVPLLTTAVTTAGFDEFEQMVDRRNFMTGIQGPRMPPRRGPLTGERHVLGVRLQGDGTPAKADAQGEAGEEKDGEENDKGEDDGDKKGGRAGMNVIVLSDLDMFADSFFSFHEQGGDMDGDGLIDIRFDNVTFLLNAIDSLSGDARFIALRKRQPEFRRLDRVDEYTEEARAEREKQMAAANVEAENDLKGAQEALQAVVDEIRSRKGIDDRTKTIMLKSAEQAENRRLQIKQNRIDREKGKTMAAIEREHLRAVDEVQDRIRLAAILLPPVPALLMGFAIFARRRRRESSTIPANRKRGAA